MFCPVCSSEYRPGFTRCSSCNVELVEDLAAAGSHPAARSKTTRRAAARETGPLMSFCGFLTLEESRAARDQLRAEGIPSEIAIREANLADPAEPVREEYWLRVGAPDFAEVERILGSPPEEDEHGDEVLCSACNRPVAEDDPACPHCGQRFEE